MYGQVKRSAHYIAQLGEFVAQTYGISIKSIVPANRGYYGETWKIECANCCYFAKLDYSRPHNLLYRDSFQVLERFSLYSIDCVSKVVKTAKGELYTEYDGAVVGLFDWIDGENVQNESTKLHEYEILSRVYAVPVNGLDIPKDDFSIAESEKFFANLARVQDREILNVFDENRDRINSNAARLKLYSDRSAKLNVPFFITHSDAGSNIMVGADGKHYLIDWDAPVIAPPERSAWFCMHWEWATDAFNGYLNDAGIEYKLNIDILAYYCYHFWFLYLNNCLEAYFDRGNFDGKVLADLKEYLDRDYWISKMVEFVDKLE